MKTDSKRPHPRTLRPAVSALAGLLALSLIACSSGRPARAVRELAAATEPGVEMFRGNEVCAGQLLVKLNVPIESLDQKQMLSMAESLTGMSISLTQVGDLNTVLASADGVSVEQMAKAFEDRANNSHFKDLIGARIEYVEPNLLLRLDRQADDPFFASQWGLENNGVTPGACGSIPGAILNTLPLADADIDATGAWSAAGTGKVVVAVLDTGVKLNHEDLRGNIWSAPRGINFQFVGGAQVNCAAGSHGFNAITKRCDDAEVNDVDGHGTHVAGIIGAAHNNPEGIKGVSPAISIMAIKVTDTQGRICSSYVADAIRFVTEVNRGLPAAERVRVLNNSYGLTCPLQNPCTPPTAECPSRTWRDAVRAADDADLLFVASAGNNGLDNDCHPHYPSNFEFDNVVAVAAMNLAGAISLGNPDGLPSNFGPRSVHIAAPGISICSLGIRQPYLYEDGTSMAAPFVSGTAALVLSKCGNMSARALKLRLIDPRNVEPLLPGGPGLIAGGRLNAEMAVRPACPP